MALGWGAFGATVLMAIFSGVRPDIVQAAWLPMFWIKLALPLSLVAGGLFAAARLSRPGARLRWVPGALAAPVIAIWLLAGYALVVAAPSDRAALVMGSTWQYCLVHVGVLAIPALIATLWAMKGLAPTRPVLAGAAAGLLAGAVGATIYALHCTEMAAPFLGTWYVAGMLIPTVAGALLGPLLLRW